MHRLKSIKDCLVMQLEAQMEHLSCVDTKELGEVVDMVKDLEEAIYYCTVTEAMNNSGLVNNTHDADRIYYREKYPVDKEVQKEGRAEKARKMYMDSKAMHHEKNVKMHELEQYMKELGEDISEMIEGASQEERELLSTKLNGLAARIDA